MPDWDSRWSNGSFTGLNGTMENDKEWAVLDRQRQVLYVTWTQFDEWGSTNLDFRSTILCSASEDLGETWSVPTRVSNEQGNATGGVGSVHASMPTVGPDGTVSVTWMSPGGIRLNQSTDKGMSWLARDIRVTDYTIQWLYDVPGMQRAPGFPVVDCDRGTGPGRGTLYICWTDQRSGSNDTDVWLAISTDNGSTWSSPRRVNDDPPGRHQFMV
ncbi:MAG: exo-alpha-sialidase [bacterium]|nr:exo-alpha-sialidase [bacterium]